MPSDYPLEDLGHENFERLAVAMARRLTGPGLQSFGRGPDGGREASFVGTIRWDSDDAETETWDGYTVFQAKHRAAPLSLSGDGDGLTWLQAQIHSEFKEWEREDSRRQKFPDYIVFISNAQLSSVAVTGGIDKLEGYITKKWETSLREKGLKGWKVWHRDYVVTDLNASQDLRGAFPGLLTAGDILSRLERIPLFAPAGGMRDFLVECESQSLRFDRWVNFAEAGGENRTSIEKVIVDLPCRSNDGDRDTSTLRRAIERGDQVLRKSLCDPDMARHLVITGAPGNGKSTLTRFIAQYYRAHFLKDDVAPGMVADIVAGISAAESRLSLMPPINSRWPLFVKLTDIADSPLSGVFPFLRWAAGDISNRTTDNVSAGWLKEWMRTWPGVIIFDGLDEVTSISARQKVIEIIENFRDEVDASDADVLIIVTTRPTGYSAADRLPTEHFEQIDLSYLKIDEALAYGEHLTAVRLVDDPNRAEMLLAKLRDAVTDKASTSLTQTPLQIQNFAHQNRC